MKTFNSLNLTEKTNVFDKNNIIYRQLALRLKIKREMVYSTVLEFYPRVKVVKSILETKDHHETQGKREMLRSTLSQSSLRKYSGDLSQIEANLSSPIYRLFELKSTVESKYTASLPLKKRKLNYALFEDVKYSEQQSDMGSPVISNNEQVNDKLFSSSFPIEQNTKTVIKILRESQQYKL